MPTANDEQVGGSHYKHPGKEEHWDRAWRMKYDCFQYIITKWVERWRDKGGIEDLYKARHAINKYIEMAEQENSEPWNGHIAEVYGVPPTKEGEPTKNYVDQ